MKPGSCRERHCWHCFEALTRDASHFSLSPLGEGRGEGRVLAKAVIGKGFAPPHPILPLKLPLMLRCEISPSPLTMTRCATPGAPLRQLEFP